MKRTFYALTTTFILSGFLLFQSWQLVTAGIGVPELAISSVDSPTNIIPPLVFPPYDAKGGNPGASLVYEFALTNTNATEDTFFFTLHTTSTFTAILTPATPINLGENISGPVALQVDIPDDALAGTVQHVVMITSTGFTTPTHFTATTTNYKVFGVQVEPDRNFGVTLGEPVVFSHTVANTGNSSQVISFTLGHYGAITPTLSTSSVTLAARETQDIQISYQVPVTAPAGTQYITTLTATVAITPSVFNLAQVTTTVGLETGLKAYPLEQNQEAYPGQIITYSHTITNTGNATDTVTITHTNSAGFNSGLNVNSSFVLTPGTPETVIVSITVPLTAAHGLVNTTTVTITSGNDSNLKVQLLDRTTVKHFFIYLPTIEKPLPPPRWYKLDGALTERTLTVAVCPTDQTIHFAGTDKGLWVWDEANAAYNKIGLSVTDLLITSVLLADDCNKVYFSIYSNGVWQATRNTASNEWGDWSQLAQGIDVSLTRNLVLANDVLVAGGDFGLAQWIGGAWQKIAADKINGVVMDLSVAEGERLYAVVWFQNVVWTTAVNNLQAWESIPGPVPNNPTIISVAGNREKSQIMLGTQEGHYLRMNGTWSLVRSTASHAYWLDSGASYVGYANRVGVYDGATRINDGFGPIPQIIYEFKHYDHDNVWLYAATTDGVWRYGQVNQ